MKQLSFDDLVFDGKTIIPELDNARLGKQSEAVYNLMIDGKWRTLADISKILGYPEASVSARLRDFRKQRFGGLTVERQRVTKGLHEYRLIK